MRWSGSTRTTSISVRCSTRSTRLWSWSAAPSWSGACASATPRRCRSSPRGSASLRAPARPRPPPARPPPARPRPLTASAAAAPPRSACSGSHRPTPTRKKSFTFKENKQDKRSPPSGRKRALRGKPASPPPTTPPRPARRPPSPPRPARRPPSPPRPARRPPSPPRPARRPHSPSLPTHGAHVISKRALAAGCKEYSNLEDHAIVAWVSAGSRASLVNGNRLWRELQTCYPSLTGCNRSWHSLRNRYLRYILPGLGALRLPPAHESRLRAAAASGVTKRKMQGLPAPPQRRNSIFKEAALRGASSRRPPPPPPSPAPPSPSPAPPSTSTSDDDEDDAPLKPAVPNGRGITNGGVTSARRSLRTLARERDGNRSPAPSRVPRYSELTRQFAARHPPASDSSAESSPAPGPARPAPAPGPARPAPGPGPARPAPAPAGTTRSRRLFNPNANVL